jgi:hypothetical protein
VSEEGGKMKYRMLKPHEKPDRAKGDEFRVSKDIWPKTCTTGQMTIRQIQELFPEADIVYRRPVRARARKRVERRKG